MKTENILTIEESGENRINLVLLRALKSKNKECRAIWDC